MPTFDHPRQTLTDLFNTAVLRAMPLHTMAAHLPPPPAPGGRTVVLGAGKAAASMAHALEQLWPEHVRAHGGADASLSDQFRRYRATTVAPDVTRFSAFASLHGAALRGSYTDAGGIRSAQSELLLAYGSLTLAAGSQYFFNTEDWLGTLSLGWQPTRPAGLPNLAYRHSLLRDGPIAGVQANDFLPDTRNSYRLSAARQQDEQGQYSDQGSLSLSQSLDDLQASYALQQNRDNRNQSVTLASAIAWHDWRPYATSYISVQELAATDWGYGGYTQQQRREMSQGL